MREAGSQPRKGSRETVKFSLEVLKMLNAISKGIFLFSFKLTGGYIAN